MKLGQSIHAADGRLLLAAGTVLNDLHIGDLAKWRVPAVYVDLGLLPPGAVQPLVSPAIREKAVRELREFFTLSQHASHLQRTPEMEETVAAIVDEVMRKQSSLVNLNEMRLYDDYLVSHSINVCVLSVMTALNMDWRKEQTVLLGLAGLLHDVGKVRVSPAILLKPGPLDREEWREMKKHPLYALDILEEEPRIMEAAAGHHESLDGSGYPYGLAGGNISAFARVIAIADLYDAMTADRVYRRAVPVNEVLELIYASGGSRFDLPFVRAFVHGVAAYPVGTVVELSDRSVGVVSENFPGLPLYPRVRLLKDGAGAPVVPPRDIELAPRRLAVNRPLTAAESFSLSRSLR